MTTHVRARNEILMDIQYAIRLNNLHRRLYRKHQFGIAFVGLFGGCAALTDLIHSRPWALAACGVVVAATGIAGALIDWTERSSKRISYNREYHKLASSSCTDAELDAALQLAYAEVTVDDIEGLREVAFNDNARTHDRLDLVRPESRSARFWRLMA